MKHFPGTPKNLRSTGEAAEQTRHPPVCCKRPANFYEHDHQSGFYYAACGDRGGYQQLLRYCGEQRLNIALAFPHIQPLCNNVLDRLIDPCRSSALCVLTIGKVGQRYNNDLKTAHRAVFIVQESLVSDRRWKTPDHAC